MKKENLLMVIIPLLTIISIACLLLSLITIGTWVSEPLLIGFCITFTASMLSCMWV